MTTGEELEVLRAAVADFERGVRRRNGLESAAALFAPLVPGGA